MENSRDWPEKIAISLLGPDHPRLRLFARLWRFSILCFALAAGGLVIGGIVLLFAVLL